MIPPLALLLSVPKDWSVELPGEHADCVARLPECALDRKIGGSRSQAMACSADVQLCSWQVLMFWWLRDKERTEMFEFHQITWPLLALEESAAYGILQAGAHKL